MITLMRLLDYRDGVRPPGSGQGARLRMARGPRLPARGGHMGRPARGGGTGAPPQAYAGA
eukprot:9495057-Pyramimonas_sp.AAC.1